MQLMMTLRGFCGDHKNDQMIGLKDPGFGLCRRMNTLKNFCFLYLHPYDEGSLDWFFYNLRKFIDESMIQHDNKKSIAIV